MMKDQLRAWAIFIVLFCSCVPGFAQNADSVDSVITPVLTTEIDTVTIRTDTITDAVSDNSVQDIAANRGVYIQSDDGLLELRILGSIRAMFNYTGHPLANKQAVNPYDVPTDENGRSPGFFAGLQQTRFGFEVTRKTQSVGDIFMRMEVDFNNGRSSLRIRHAYGTIGGFLVGQTWSLLNNAGYQPLAVSHQGPAGAISIRTPQIRYTRRYQNKTSWSLALEYAPPDIDEADTHLVTSLQVTPSLTGRYTLSSDRLTFRIAGLVTLLGGRGEQGGAEYRPGFGGSMALSLSTGKGALFGSVTAGRAIGSYLNVFRNHDQDAAYDPTDQEYKTLFATAAYLAYEHPLSSKLRASVALGYAALHDQDYRPSDTYDHGYNLLLNIFWYPVSGLSVGMEYGFGARTDINDMDGLVGRVSILAYYDF